MGAKLQQQYNPGLQVHPEAKSTRPFYFRIAGRRSAAESVHHLRTLFVRVVDFVAATNGERSKTSLVHFLRASGGHPDALTYCIMARPFLTTWSKICHHCSPRCPPKWPTPTMIQTGLTHSGQLS
jgi:hypothetical protein